ncbi:protein of unknown function [Hyphomicrobium sp. MC1]|nr:protein of unknown function [Hyphomicrobium sp. MC1]
MNDEHTDATSKTECAFRPTAVTSTCGSDGRWVAHWVENVGRAGEVVKSRGGFETEGEALAFGRKLELISRLNRC